ncbi:MAG: hypothetical protein D6732_16375 [Methanobacteriota archaeon]|nr:MAG: hypothetical protein D6732_16375 [Euryarchaeota archaeon]
MKIVISQPMYFPWIGLLEQVRLADIFVFYDDVQFVKGSFFNRVQVPTPWGIRWMTVLLKGVRLGQKINEVKVDNGRPWKRQHCELLKQAYRKAPFFNDMMGIVEDVFSVDSDLLVDFSMASTMSLVKYFDLDCGRKFLHSSSLDISGKGSERVLEIVVSLGGSVYITGHGAKNYLNHNLFEKRGIEVLYMDYACKEYPQLHGPFTPFVSALDLVANCGKEGRNMFISQTVNWRRFMS